MTEPEWRDKLKSDGFTGMFVQEDPPGAHYPPHRHGRVTAHVVLAGLMELTVGGVARTVGFGERFDVPAGEVHEARVGPSGCRYLIGEK